ncbi:polyprenyl synthetase family protein [Bacillus gobiensis]|uniref:polyprenyl synthetase family protein n=1 Tax=Bacillus gobiensis TaxID=1441095 RepID=UPI003D25A401
MKKVAVNLQEFLRTRKETIEHHLPIYVKQLNAPPILKESMLYSLEAGGKRLRPILVLALLHAYGKNEEQGLPIGCAVEMIHTYSLIHDDLPCMDDDDLRRGKPTNHKVFGEAAAVLAGDGLLTEAFRVIATLDMVSAEKRIALIKELSSAIGAEGMVGGQVADMEAEGKKVTPAELEAIHAMKTAKLLSFSIVAGAILSDAPNVEIERLRQFGFHIGIAFQIRDDILDLEGSEDKIGKRIGSDTANEKTTYPSMLTLTGAKEKLNDHIQSAKGLLYELSLEKELLTELCELIGNRDH